MTPTPEPEEPLPANLRFLRLLVTVLTGVMIVGIAAIVALMAASYIGRTAPLPEQITLPDGARATAYTQGDGWFAVVTDDQRILIFDRASGALRQQIRVDSGAE